MNYDYGIEQIDIEVPELHEGQQYVHDNALQYNVICNGRRWGKTIYAIYLIIISAVENVWSIGYFTPTYKQLIKTWRRVCNTLQPLIQHKSEQFHSIELINGSVIDFWSLDNPDNIRGDGYDLIIIDEAAAQINLEYIWDYVLEPMLIVNNGRAYFISTPQATKGGDNYFETLYNYGLSNDYSEWKSFQFPTETNPYISKEILKRIRETKTELAYAQEYEAKFVHFGGVLFSKEWIQNRYWPDVIEDIAIGVDLAISRKATADYTVIVVMSKDAEGNLYVMDVVRFRDTFNNVVKKIIEVAAKWNVEKIAVEAVAYQVGVVHELRRLTQLNIIEERPTTDKVQRAQVIAARYEQRLVYHAPNLIKEFEKELLSFPESNHDDCVDALTYAYKALDRTPPMIWEL